MSSSLLQMADWCYEQSLTWSLFAQGRKVNKTRGAWRRPQLSQAVGVLNRQLLDLYDFTEHAIVLLLAGEDVPAIEQDSSDDDPVAAALAYHGLSAEDGGRPLDTAVLSAVLLILARFREKQLSLAGAAVQATFSESRAALLKRLKREGTAVSGSAAVLISQVIRLYEDDAQRFYRDLLDPSPRSQGVREIVEGSETLGAAVVALRQLFDTEQYRLTLFSEALTWDAWMAGFRVAAVEATNAAFLAGVAPPQFKWLGPDDGRTCDPCRALFGDTVTAHSLADLPAPHTVCEYRRACRHWWGIL